MTPKRCNLCSGEDFEVIARRDRRGEPLDTGMCTRCGLVCHMEIPTEAEEAEFYAKDYRREYDREETPSSKHVMRAWRRGEQLFRHCAKRLEPGARVFEVGAGLGCTVKHFDLGGFPASGIEPGMRWQEFSQSKLCADVRQGRIEDLEPEPVNDLVLLVHVIEHFRSPRDALSRVARLLKPGGLLYMECPNLAAPFTNRPRLFHRAHIHNFTPSSLTMLAGDCGFRVVEPQQDESEPVISMMFRYTDESRLVVDGRNRERTLSAIERFDGGRFYFRPVYYWQRARKLAGYVQERIKAGAFVRRVLERCKNGDPGRTILAGPRE